MWFRCCRHQPEKTSLFVQTDQQDQHVHLTHYILQDPDMKSVQALNALTVYRWCHLGHGGKYDEWNAMRATWAWKKKKKNWTNLKTAICQPWSLLHKSNFYVYEMMNFFFELILNKCDFWPKCPTVLLYRGVKTSALNFFWASCPKINPLFLIWTMHSKYRARCCQKLYSTPCRCST